MLLQNLHLSKSSDVPQSDNGLIWRDLDQLDAAARTQALLAVKDFIRHHSAAVMDHDPDWLYAKSNHNKSVKIFLYFAQDGSLSGYAPFFVHPSSLSFGLLGISLWEYQIRRYSITAGPLLAEGINAEKILLSLFDYLWRRLGNREILFGLGVELDSLFGRFLQNNTNLRKKYSILLSGKPYHRRLIVLPGNFDEYIQNLGYGTRKEVRRVLRRLEQDPKISINYRVFTTLEDIAEFLLLAQQVSDKTYQRNLLGLGIQNNSETRRIISNAAENGWFQSYLLICNQEPVAFQHGYIYNGTYYAEQTGYDPIWKSKSVGTIVQIYRIRDLINRGVTRLDFLYGDNERKRSLSNTYRIEQNIYLISDKFPLNILAYALRIFNFISESLGDFIERWGLKSRIRRYLRKRSIK